MPLTRAGNIPQRITNIACANANNAGRKYRSIFGMPARAAASIRRLANLAPSARIKELFTRIKIAIAGSVTNLSDPLVSSSA
jgi:hypothetical protein